MVAMRHWVAVGFLLAAAWFALVGQGWAQQPSQSQVSAIRQSCRSDYQVYCASVPPGGQASLACLKEHSAKLSPSCGRAVAAIGGGPSDARSPVAPPAIPGPSSPAPAPSADPHWPHNYSTDAGSIVVYEPQVISWPDRAVLNARAAVAVTRRDSSTPILGTIEVALRTQLDPTGGRVILTEPKLVASHFPSLDTAQAATLEGHLAEALPRMETKSVPLDMVLLGLKDAVTLAALNNDPPVIFHSERAAVLLLFDGPPVLAPVAGTGLQVAVNANWAVFADPSAATWYLLAQGIWYVARDHAGPYQPVSTLPPDFGKLPADASFADIRKYIPARNPAGPAASIFASEKPAEIIVTTGPAAFVAVRGTSLQRATNTASTLYRDSTGKLYFLTSGRWFSAASLDGPWSFATPTLPAEFALIPPDATGGSVLVSVPGTAEAQQAVLSAQLPEQATLDRNTAKFEAQYTGTPVFKPIGSIGVAYAINSADPILKVGDKYYACKDGAWFVAAEPAGPWLLADVVPPAIYSIPPTNPAYPVTYVRVYAATPAAVTYGYTAGYALGFVTAGVLAYGTGYYYPPVVVPGPVPIYYPYPRTYAGGVYYNPNTGVWAHGGAAYGPYGGAGAWSAYNPSTGFYAHGSATWSNGYGTAYASFNNPATGRSGSTTQNVTPYSRWGSSQISGPNQTVHTASGSNARGSAGAFQSSTGAEGAGVHGANGRNAGVVKGAGGNVYAGADGNVYRHDSDGWSKMNNGSWQPVNRPTGSGTGSMQGTARSDRLGAPASNGSIGAGQCSRGQSSQLEQDRFARERGNGIQRGYGEFGRRERFR